VRASEARCDQIKRGNSTDRSIIWIFTHANVIEQLDALFKDGQVGAF